MKVFINGFGRIGRTLLRQILTTRSNENFDIVGINDLADIETCAYLFRYDSVFGPFPGEVTCSENKLIVGGKSIPVFQCEDLSSLRLDDVNIVLECTGKATTRLIAERGLNAGAKAVLISGPSEAADQTIVIGANEETLERAHIISNSSCTTNAIAPLLRSLNTRFGIEVGHITTIHCYTGSQPTLDAPGPSLERSRAAAVSMVPTTTSAASQVSKVLPDFEGRLSVTAVRVPCISVSAIDAVIELSRSIRDPRAELLEMAQQNGVISTLGDACVSTDLRMRPESLIIALPELQAVHPKRLRLFGWYDNEWAFSSRMLDTAQLIDCTF